MADVTITISGDAAGVTAAANTAVEAMQRVEDQSRVSTSNMGSSFGMLGALDGPLSTVWGWFGNLAQSVEQFGINWASTTAALLATQAFSFITDQVKNLTEEMFNLSVNTEKAAYTWKYLLGGGMQGTDLSQQLMQWTSQASLQMPYTRQDVLGAVTAMLGVGFNEQGVEQYLPLLSDIGATRNPNMTLTQIAGVIQSAMMGYSRMLRYDLHIDPAQLAKYGYVENAQGRGDPTTLLPALQKWAQANGYVGASSDIANNTWWGEWSSFVDRIQNFGLGAAGMNLDGTVNKGTFFGNLKADLEGVSQWMTTHKDDLDKLSGFISGMLGNGVSTVGGLAGNAALSAFQWLTDHQAQISNIADTVSKLLSGGMTAGGNFFSGFFSGLDQSGANKTALTDLKDAAAWLADPKNQEQIKQLGQTIGDNVGGALTALDTDFKNLKKSADDFKNSLTPGELTAIGDAFKGVGNTINIFSGELVDQMEQLKWFNKALVDMKNGDPGAAVSDLGEALKFTIKGDTGLSSAHFNGDPFAPQVPKPNHNPPSGTSAAPGTPGKAYADGGWITEQIIGIGLQTGTQYTLGEDGNEYVLSSRALRSMAQVRTYGADAGGGGLGNYVVININGGDLAAVKQTVQDVLAQSNRAGNQMLRAPGGSVQLATIGGRY